MTGGKRLAQKTAKRIAVRNHPVGVAGDHE